MVIGLLVGGCGFANKSYYKNETPSGKIYEDRMECGKKSPWKFSFGHNDGMKNIKFIDDCMKEKGYEIIIY